MRELKAAGYTVIVAVLVTACNACGGPGNSLKAHSYAAQTFENVAVEGREAALEMRAHELREAGEIAQAAGADVEAAVRSAAADFDEGPVINAVNAFIAAKQVYVQGVLVAVGDEQPSFTHLRALLNDAALAYQSLRLALGEAGKRLPDLPASLIDLL